MNMNIPVPDSVQDELKAMFTSLAKEVIAEVAAKEMTAKDWLNLKEVQAYLGISFNTLKLYERKYSFPIIEIEGKRFVSKDSLNQWMKSFERKFEK